MKVFIPNEKERRAIAVLVDAVIKEGMVRSEETYDCLSNLKRQALAGLPPEKPAPSTQEVKK